MIITTRALPVPLECHAAAGPAAMAAVACGASGYGGWPAGRLGEMGNFFELKEHGDGGFWGKVVCKPG